MCCILSGFVMLFNYSVLFWIHHSLHKSASIFCACICLSVWSSLVPLLKALCCSIPCTNWQSEARCFNDPNMAYFLYPFKFHSIHIQQGWFFWSVIRTDRPAFQQGWLSMKKINITETHKTAKLFHCLAITCRHPCPLLFLDYEKRRKTHYNKSSLRFSPKPKLLSLVNPLTPMKKNHAHCLLKDTIYINLMKGE
jgi:hypothetical protein